jgi:hypothetical protein
MLEEAFRRMKESTQRARNLTACTQEAHAAMIAASGDQTVAIDGVGAVVVETRNGLAKVATAVEVLNGNVCAWKASQDETAVIFAKKLGVAGVASKTLWQWLCGLKPTAIAGVVAASLTVVSGVGMGVKAFLNAGRATMDKQVEARAATGVENKATQLSIDDLRQLMREEREADRQEQSKIAKEIVVAELAQFKVEALKWQAERLAAEKAGKH